MQKSTQMQEKNQIKLSLSVAKLHKVQRPGNLEIKASKQKQLKMWNKEKSKSKRGYEKTGGREETTQSCGVYCKARFLSLFLVW